MFSSARETHPNALGLEHRADPCQHVNEVYRAPLMGRFLSTLEKRTLPFIPILQLRNACYSSCYESR